MDISVAITTFNRAASLAQTLDAMLAQDFRQADFEVIVADNGSVDDTKAVCDSFSNKFENFAYLYDNRPGQLVGWHRSMAIMQGEVCCFIDDDVRPGITWLAALKETYADPAVGLATGPIKLAYETEPPEWIEPLTLGEPGSQTLPIFGLLDCGGEVREIPGNFVWGTNFTVRMMCLLEAEGFHPCAMPGRLLHFHGDGEIHVGRSVDEAGHRVIYHPQAGVEHDIPARRTTLEAVKSKFITNGYARSFQTIRETGEAYELPSDHEIRVMALRYFNDPEFAPSELLSVIEDGIREGLSKHLNHFNNDPAFRELVLRDNFLDLEACYSHPDLAPQENNGEPVADWREGED